MTGSGGAPILPVIAPDPRPPADPAVSEAEIDAVFDRMLPLIRVALAQYRLGNRESSIIERDLRRWFSRLVQRVNNGQTPVFAFRKYLVLAACEFAYSYQLRNAEAGGRLKEVLARNPRSIAGELQKMLDP